MRVYDEQTNIVIVRQYTVRVRCGAGGVGGGEGRSGWNIRMFHRGASLWNSSWWNGTGFRRELQLHRTNDGAAKYAMCNGGVDIATTNIDMVV